MCDRFVETDMTFEMMAYVMSVAGCVLGLRFIFAGASVLKEWGLEVTDGALVICRRLGAVYLGLALMFFLGRGAAPSDLRSAVCLGVGGASALLAGLGLFERRAGRVGSRIIVPAIVEIVLAAGFVWTWWSGR
ncbi:MAG: hypothetical protein U1F43_22110 [Myxococcota bacterium]